MNSFQYASDPPENCEWQLWIGHVYQFVLEKMSHVYFLWFISRELYILYGVPQEIFTIICRIIYKNCYLIQDTQRLSSNNYQDFVDWIHYYLNTPTMHIYGPLNENLNNLEVIQSIPTIQSLNTYAYPIFPNRPWAVLGFAFYQDVMCDIDKCYITCNELGLSSLDFSNFFIYQNIIWYFDICFSPMLISDACFNDIKLNIRYKRGKKPSNLLYLCMNYAHSITSFDTIVMLKNEEDEYHIKIENGTVNYINPIPNNYGNRQINVKFINETNNFVFTV